MKGKNSFRENDSKKRGGKKNVSLICGMKKKDGTKCQRKGKCPNHAIKESEKSEEIEFSLDISEESQGNKVRTKDRCKKEVKSAENDILDEKVWRQNNKKLEKTDKKRDIVMDLLWKTKNFKTEDKMEESDYLEEEGFNQCIPPHTLPTDSQNERECSPTQKVEKMDKIPSPLLSPFKRPREESQEMCSPTQRLPNEEIDESACSPTQKLDEILFCSPTQKLANLIYSPTKKLEDSLDCSPTQKISTDTNVEEILCSPTQKVNKDSLCSPTLNLGETICSPTQKVENGVKLSKAESLTFSPTIPVLLEEETYVCSPTQKVLHSQNWRNKGGERQDPSCLPPQVLQDNFSCSPTQNLDDFLSPIKFSDVAGTKFGLSSPSYSQPKSPNKSSARKSISVRAECEDKVICECGEGEESKRTFIQCESCLGWEHMVCVGLDESQDVSNLVYYCKRCKSFAPAFEATSQTSPETFRKKHKPSEGSLESKSASSCASWRKSDVETPNNCNSEEFTPFLSNKKRKISVSPLKFAIVNNKEHNSPSRVNLSKKFFSCDEDLSEMSPVRDSPPYNKSTGGTLSPSFSPKKSSLTPSVSPPSNRASQTNQQREESNQNMENDQEGVTPLKLKGLIQKHLNPKSGIKFVRPQIPKKKKDKN